MIYLHYSTEFLPLTIPEKTNLIFHQIKTACKVHSPSTFGKGLDRLSLASLVTQHTLYIVRFSYPSYTPIYMVQTGLFRSKTTCSNFSKFPETLEITAFLRFLNNGAEGSRTPVRKPIHCTSTSLANCLTFPPPDLNQHNSGFSRL